MIFKDQFIEDINIFLNSDEFADIITFEESGFKKEINALFNEIISNNDVATSIYFSVKTSDVEKLSESSTIKLDGVEYGIVSWASESGITDILVQRI